MSSFRKTIFVWISVFIIIGFFSILPFLIRANSMPEIGIDPQSSETKPSARFGYKVLEAITKKHHPYNSAANLEVRSYLIDTLKEIQHQFQSQWKCSQPDPFEFIQDDIYMKSSLNNYTALYESNNVLFSIAGAKKESLLISAHFDSAIESYGATDDGIAVASMVAVIQSLARNVCQRQLSYSLIFNFNNGEEINLQGASAFTLHPYYKNVKAFINLEGTGVSQEFSSFLFRTNSFKLVSLLMKDAPSPHSSIIANNIMRFLKRFTLVLVS